jgi:hypothetical protein
MTRSWRTQSTTKARRVCNEMKVSKIQGLGQYLNLATQARDCAQYYREVVRPFVGDFPPDIIRFEVLQRVKLA